MGVTRFIRLLQHIHSGELAAALAYRGHAQAVRAPEERTHLRTIEREEWTHRARLGEMLAELGAEPEPYLEIRKRWTGALLGALCRVTGWFLPMWGAALFEGRNVTEYAEAAHAAEEAGRPDWVGELLEMGEQERAHERWFLERVREP